MEPHLLMRKTVTLWSPKGHVTIVPEDEKDSWKSRGYLDKKPEVVTTVEPPKPVAEEPILINPSQTQKAESKVETPKVSLSPEDSRLHDSLFNKMTKEQLLTYAKQQNIVGVRGDMKRDFILKKIKSSKGMK